VVDHPIQRVASLYPPTFAPLVAGDRAGVLHVLCNPVDTVFGHQFGGQRLAYTFFVLMAALRQATDAGGRQPAHVITDISHIVTHWQYCGPSIVIVVPPVIIIVMFVLAAILSSPVRVIVFYGENVRRRVEEALIGANRSEWIEYQGVRFCSLTVSATRRVWLVDTCHPSYRQREGRIVAAVILAVQLWAHDHPLPADGHSLHSPLTEDVMAAIDTAIVQAELMFGPGEVGARQWEAKEDDENLEEDEERKEDDEKKDDEHL
jgi:hypothetical protein